MKILIAFLMLLPVVVFATDKTPTKTTPPQIQDQEQQQNSNSFASANSNSTNDGNELSVDGNQFYALSLMFPDAAGCFTGIQGGANEDNRGGFLGFHILNKSCWADKLASQEQDIEINARLKCSDMKYRNALAYDVPRKQRQAACIAMKVKSGRNLVATLEKELVDLQQQKDEAAEKCNDDKNTITDAATRTLEKCVNK